MGRPEGTLLTKLPGFRKIFPFLMKSRAESTIYYHQQVVVEDALRWLDDWNRKHDRRLSLFYVFLAAAVRTLATCPDANRFVVGRRIYQRHAITLTFVVKRALTEEATETTLKLDFERTDTFDDVAERVRQAVEGIRESSSSSEEDLTDRLARLPRFVNRLAVWGLGVLDYFNLLPASFIKGDPFYASAFLANLGSIELDPVFHHLYEYGTIPFFAVLGKIKKAPVAVEDEQGDRVEVARVAEATFTVDERTTDGVYYARTINTLLDHVRDPARLQEPPADLPDPYALA